MHSILLISIDYVLYYLSMCMYGSQQSQQESIPLARDGLVRDAMHDPPPILGLPKVRHYLLL